MCSATRLPPKLHPLHRRYSAFAPAILLSEENIRKTVTKFSKMKSIKVDPHGPTRNAAVLIPVCLVDDKVSFPGGMEDAGDVSPLKTALRETEEELGIKQERVEVWGQGNPVISRAMTKVTPVVGFVHSDSITRDMRVNPGEVKEVFAVPVEVLCGPSNMRHTQFKGGYSLPVFIGGKRKVWGLTAIITHFFLKAFVPKEAYTHTVKLVPPLKGARPYRFL